MYQKKWIRPIIAAMLFGAFLTGQSRSAMAEETEAETAPSETAVSAGALEESRTAETEVKMTEYEKAEKTEKTEETEKPQEMEMLSALDGECVLTMRKTGGQLFSDQSMAQMELLSGEDEARAKNLLSAKIASDFVLTNPDVPFNEEDIGQMTQEIRDNFLSFFVFRADVTGPDEGCEVTASVSVPDNGLSDYSSTGCRNIIFQVSTDWNIAVIDHDNISFDAGTASFGVTGSGSLIFGIAQFPSDWLYSDLNEVMMRRINEVIAKENGTEELPEESNNENGKEASTNQDPESESGTQNRNAEDALTAEAGDLRLLITHENGAPFDKGTTIEVGDMEKEEAEKFKKAICDETGEKKLTGFTTYQITFRKADGSSYTLWHLILEVEGAGKDQKLAVMTRDGKIRISDESSGDRLKITSETIAAAALFSAGR